MSSLSFWARMAVGPMKAICFSSLEVATHFSLWYLIACNL